MAFNARPQPYQPPSNALATGIAQAGAGIGSGLAQMGQRIQERQEEQKRIVQNGKLAEGIMKANPELLNGIGMTIEEFGALSAQDKASLSQAAITGFTLQQQREEHQRRLEEFEAAKRERANQARLPQLYGALAESGQAPEAVMSPFSNAEFDRRTEMEAMPRLADALRQSGYDPTVQEAGHILDAIRQANPQMQQVQFAEDPVSKQRFATFGNSMMPSGSATGAGGAVQTVPILDENGNVIGRGIQSRSGGISLVRQNRGSVPTQFNRTLDRIFKEWENLKFGLDAGMLTERSKETVPAQMESLIRQAEAAAERERIAGAITKEDKEKYLAQFKTGETKPGEQEKVMVEKDGKRYHLPSSQLDKAIKQGYKLIE